MSNTWTKYSERLLSVTKGCRSDMHEPDEQGLDAVVHAGSISIRGSFDNAMGDMVDGSSISKELVVELTRDTGLGRSSEYFNLATLVALARVGARVIVETKEFIVEF